MPIRPNRLDDFTQWGLTAYTVEYWSGSSWIQLPNPSVTGNDKIWPKFEFSPISTSNPRRGIEINVYEGSSNAVGKASSSLSTPGRVVIMGVHKVDGGRSQ